MAKIVPGNTYVFTKSGSEVRAIAQSSSHNGQEMWEVERTSGFSSGKRMDVPVSALMGNFEQMGALACS